MNPESEWEVSRDRQGSRLISAGMGTLRITLLFGSAAVALALIAAPLLDDTQSRPRITRGGVDGIDLMSTGGIGLKESYTIRRSVLQASPDAICIIRANGARSGDC